MKNVIQETRNLHQGDHSSAARPIGAFQFMYSFGLPSSMAPWDLQNLEELDMFGGNNQMLRETSSQATQLIAFVIPEYFHNITKTPSLI